MTPPKHCEWCDARAGVLFFFRDTDSPLELCETCAKRARNAEQAGWSALKEKATCAGGMCSKAAVMVNPAGKPLCLTGLPMLGRSKEAKVIDEAPPKPKACSALVEALAAVEGPRRETYGHPRDNHARTAALWSAYLGVKITPRQVCMLNILQKVSRDAHRPHRDNLVDIAGYVANIELAEEKAP